RKRASPGGGSAAASFQRALWRRASRARMACSSRRAATARNRPSRTTATTPGMRRTFASSTETSSAPGDGGPTPPANTHPRAPDPADPHPRQPDVLDVGGAARELPRDVAAGHALANPSVAIGRPGGDLRAGLAPQVDAGGEVPVRDRGPAGGGHGPVVDLQV